MNTQEDQIIESPALMVAISKAFSEYHSDPILIHNYRNWIEWMNSVYGFYYEGTSDHGSHFTINDQKLFEFFLLKYT